MAYGLQLHDIYKQLLMKTFGIILIVAGIAMILIRGFSVTTEKNVVDVGPLEVNKKENKWIGWPTYAGAVVAVVGVIMVVSAKKRA
jgi:drug/metabolite transporter (DMT)-like permease